MAAGLDVVEPTAKVVTKTELSGDPVKLRSSSVNCFGKKGTLPTLILLLPRKETF